jgi:hypothetical protein
MMSRLGKEMIMAYFNVLFCHPERERETERRNHTKERTVRIPDKSANIKTG